jgi:hypothetical protein
MHILNVVKLPTSKMSTLHISPEWLCKMDMRKYTDSGNVPYVRFE